MVEGNGLTGRTLIGRQHLHVLELVFLRPDNQLPHCIASNIFSLLKAEFGEDGSPLFSIGNVEAPKHYCSVLAGSLQDILMIL